MSGHILITNSIILGSEQNQSGGYNTVCLQEVAYFHLANMGTGQNVMWWILSLVGPEHNFAQH